VSTKSGANRSARIRISTCTIMRDRNTRAAVSWMPRANECATT